MYFKTLKLQNRHFFAIVSPVGKPTQLESLDSELFRLRYSHFNALGDLQYLGVRAGESGAIICCCIMYIISDIDVTSMMTMLAIDIWGDRHASDL